MLRQHYPRPLTEVVMHGPLTTAVELPLHSELVLLLHGHFVKAHQIFCLYTQLIYKGDMYSEATCI